MGTGPLSASQCVFWTKASTLHLAICLGEAQDQLPDLGAATELNSDMRCKGPMMKSQFVEFFLLMQRGLLISFVVARLTGGLTTLYRARACINMCWCVLFQRDRGVSTQSRNLPWATLIVDGNGRNNSDVIAAYSYKLQVEHRDMRTRGNDD